MDLNKGIFKLQGIVQHYSWGGFDFIPDFLGIPNKDHRPYAEYWLGAHPNFPAKISEGNSINLKDLIESNLKNTLGEETIKKFDSLPYLLKILDVRQMLSIQVHPDKKTASIEYEEENKKGIALNAPNRNYKDKNHKPELMVALGDFWLLHGFKNKKDIQNILSSVKELNFLKDVFERGGYKELYEHIMYMEQKKIQEILDPLLKRIIPLYEQNKLTRDKEDFWAARAALTFCKEGSIDRGIFSIYFFNLLHLKKGEGVFQPEGMPHAYLEGQNVEVMANSDNVLRAGLTDKHIDTKELMRHVNFKETIPNIISPDHKRVQRVFESPAMEFELHQYQIPKDHTQHVNSITGEIWLVYEGSILLNNKNIQLSMNKGESVFVLPGQVLNVTGQDNSTVFRVSIPEQSKN